MASASPARDGSKSEATRSRSPTTSPPPPDGGLLAVRCDVRSHQAGRRRVRQGRGRARQRRRRRRERRDRARRAVAADDRGSLDRRLRHRPDRASTGSCAARSVRWSVPIGAGSCSSPPSSRISGSVGPGELRRRQGGLVGMARSLAREVGSRGITVNVVAPASWTPI